MPYLMESELARKRVRLLDLSMKRPGMRIPQHGSHKVRGKASASRQAGTHRKYDPADSVPESTEAEKRDTPHADLVEEGDGEGSSSPAEGHVEGHRHIFGKLVEELPHHAHADYGQRPN